MSTETLPRTPGAHGVELDSPASGGWRAALLALGGYVLLSCLLFGRGVVGHLGSVVVGSGQSPMFFGRDQGAFTWFLAWGAQVLTHPENPFFTHAVYAPQGYNLAWAASLPGPALLLAPLTILIGAVPMFNLLALLAPAAAAWTAYLLCRQLGPRQAPALLGGLLFGFSTYESVETVNHLNLALIALLPLVPLLAIRRQRGLISRRVYILGLTAIAVGQLWTSTEVFASAVVFGAIALAISLLVASRGERSRLVEIAGESLIALALAAALSLPLLLAALGPNPVAARSTVNDGADLAGFIVPTRITWLHSSVLQGRNETSLGGNFTEQESYLGPLLIVVFVWFAIAARRSRLVRGAALFGLVAAIMSLGGILLVLREGTGVELPWGLIGGLGPLSYALPGRFVVYVWLALAIVIASALQDPHGTRGRWIAALAACASILPNTTGLVWATPVDAPPLLKSSRLAHYVAPGSTVLALPFGAYGNSMQWQVEAGFAFKLAGGYVSWAVPAGYRNQTIVHELAGRPPGAGLAQRLCSFIAMSGATTILLREGTPGDWKPILAPLDVRPAHSGGFAIYPLAHSSCTRTSSAGRPKPRVFSVAGP